MDIAKKYCIYTGTTRGTLEYSFCVPGENIPFCPSSQPSEVTTLEWGRVDDEIIVGYKNGNVALYNPLQNNYTKNISKLEGTGPVVGVGCFDKDILIAKHDGIINIWNRKNRDFFSINLDEKGSLDCMVYNKLRGGLIGTGGEFNDFKLWNIETKQCVFRAKSMGHDELNLPIPTSVRGITFLSDNLNVIATKEGHVLLYDERTQRRPVVKFLEPKASYSCITSAYRDRQVLVGTTKGYMQLIDMKVPGKCLRTFTTFTGSITGIVCDSMEPLVATASLDRHLRVHNIETKELIYKAYLKQSLCKILMKPVVKEEKNNDQIVDKNVDHEFEELFEKMETITEKKPIRKKLTIPTGTNSTTVELNENKITKKKKQKKLTIPTGPKSEVVESNGNKITQKKRKNNEGTNRVVKKKKNL